MTAPEMPGAEVVRVDPPAKVRVVAEMAGEAPKTVELAERMEAPDVSPKSAKAADMRDPAKAMKAAESVKAPETVKAAAETVKAAAAKSMKTADASRQSSAFPKRARTVPRRQGGREG
ncbi:MAG TPA: hypothetical protein VK446_14585 [Methylocystis sp.]|nr:hypothetical protein [Methylocystis sp.]